MRPAAHSAYPYASGEQTAETSAARVGRVRPRLAEGSSLAPGGAAAGSSSSSSSSAHSLSLRQLALMRAHERATMGDGDGDDGGEMEAPPSQLAGEDSVTKSEEVRSSDSVVSLSSVSVSALAISVDRTRERVSSYLQEDVVARITTLKTLCDEGFISEDEYDRRKGAIMDELTTFASHATCVHGSFTPSERSTFTTATGLPLIVPHAPDFRDIGPEIATKHVFDYATRQWSSRQVYVLLDETPFSKGSLRVVYHLQDMDELELQQQHEQEGYEVKRRHHHQHLRGGHIGAGGGYVAKVAIDPDEDPQTYFRDIELQAHCAHYARIYNSYHPPKRVEFLAAWVLELTERDNTLCAVEEYIPGEYRKHNNNFGSVSDDERNTPQAFSHFTYEVSNHELLAVDIQGVGDKYTDPQIHTLKGNDFGKGNLGALGFQKFLSSHQCNSICRYLKLPAVNPKDRHNDRGTLPLQELMNTDRVRPARFDSKHYYEHAPMLQKYITHCREMEEKARASNDASASTRERCARLFSCGCAVQ